MEAKLKYCGIFNCYLEVKPTKKRYLVDQRQRCCFGQGKAIVRDRKSLMDEPLSKS